jgi:c-di-GMP-binding flagellar brake protein YcgR
MTSLAEKLQTATDRREFPRVLVAIPGQILLAAENVARAAQVLNLSAGGAGLRYAGVVPRHKMLCVLTMQGFGRFEGMTVRSNRDSCGFRFLPGEAQREHLLERLTIFVGSGLATLISLQNQQHWSPNTQLSLTRQSGQQIACNVMDISIQGVTLFLNATVPEGENVLVGKMFGQVVHAANDQVTVQFIRYLGEKSAA